MTFTPEQIEKFRQVGLRLDRNGRWWHQGEEITHPRLRQALLRWLDVRDDDRRPIVRLDETRYAYVDVDDAHLLVTSARWDGDGAFVLLNDGREEELAYDSLRVGDDDAVYCTARGGRLDARITTPAWAVLAERIEADGADGPEGSDGFVLGARGRRFAIGHR